MSTVPSRVPSRVQRHRQAEAARRRVRTTGINRIGKRTVIPKPKPPPKRKRPKYQTAGLLGSFSGMCVALFAATGSILWAVGGVASGVGGVASAYLEYRRELLEVKRTGRPIGAPDPAQAPQLAAQPAAPPPAKPAPAAKKKTKPADDHLARCKAKPPGGPTCRCPDGPNRKGTKRRVEAGRRKRG